MLDVVELLARSADRPLTLAVLVRDLDITRATAHAILRTLTDRGWARRDPVDKSYAVGPALDLAARRAANGGSLEHLARAAAAQLVDEFGFSASITQVVAGAVVITDFVAPAGADIQARPGDRVPLTAPFGLGFVAWEPQAARRAWIRRAGVANASVRDELEASLAAVRRRGFAIECMSRSIAQAIDLANNLPDAASEAMREIVDRLLVEVTSLGRLPDDVRAAPRVHVSTIAAPVLDRSGRVALNIGVSPFCEMSGRRVAQIGRALTRAAARIQRAPHGDERAPGTP